MNPDDTQMSIDIIRAAIDNHIRYIEGDHTEENTDMARKWLHDEETKLAEFKVKFPEFFI